MNAKNEFNTNNLQNIKDAIFEMKGTMELQTEIFKVSAELKKAEFDSYIDAGFKPNQAMDLIRAKLNAEIIADSNQPPQDDLDFLTPK